MFPWNEMLIALFQEKEIRDLKKFLSYSPGGTCNFNIGPGINSFCFFASKTQIKISVTTAVPINWNHEDIDNYTSEEFTFSVSAAERSFKIWNSKQMTLF